MPRKSPDDDGRVNEYGWQNCPGCGKKVTTCAFGFNSHLIACFKKRGFEVLLSQEGNMLIGRRLFKVLPPRRPKAKSNTHD